MQKKIVIYLFLIFSFLIMGCPNPSNSRNDEEINYLIQDLKVSKMTATDTVDLVWTTVIGANEYKVFKYREPDEGSLIETFSFVDDTPEVVKTFKVTDRNFVIERDKNLPFYYKVSYIKNSKESEKSDYEYVLFSIEDEPETSNKSVPIEFKDNIKSALSSSLDNTNETFDDTDLYKITCLPENPIIEIKNLNSNNIETGDLEIVFSYNGTEYPYSLDISDTRKITTCIPDIFNGNEPRKSINIFFKISLIRKDLEDKKFISYEISKLSKVINSIKDFTASKMSTLGRINLSWTSIKGVSEYTIYKYSKANEDFILKEISFIDEEPEKVKSLKFIDDDFLFLKDFNKPFFYKISYLSPVGESEDNVETNKSRFKYGVFGETIDPFEPKNNDKPKDSALSSIFDNQNPNIYSFPDGNNGIVSDVDWYKLRISPCSFDLKFQVIDSSNIKNGDVVLQFQYKHEGENLEKKYELNAKGITSCTFSYPGHMEEEVIDIYYKIYFKGRDSSQDKFLEYTIKR